MSKTKILALSIALGGFTSVAASAQTIDALIVSQRAKLVEEANKKNNPLAVIANQGTAPIQLQTPPSLPALGPLPELPGMSGEPQKPVEKPIMKAVFDIANTKYVAVYGMNGNLIAEIAYNGSVARVTKNAELIDGWIVQSIDDKKVVLTKSEPKKGPATHVLLYNIGDSVIKTTAIPPKKLPKKKISVSIVPAPTIEQLGTTSAPISPQATTMPAPATATAAAAPVPGALAPVSTQPPQVKPVGAK